mgnify:CR=1 FL=1
MENPQQRRKIMGNISINKLGGLSIIIGPWLALIFYFLQPGGTFIDAVDPADPIATITAIVGNPGLGQLTGILIPIGLLIFLYGFFVLRGTLRGGNGDALGGYGVQFLMFGVIGWVISSGMLLAIAGTTDTNPAVAVPTFGSLYGASQGIGTIAGLLAGLGFLLVALALSTRDEFNKIFALVAAVAAVAAVIFVLIGALDSTQLQLMNSLVGICYVIHSLWMVTIGLVLLKQD